MNKYKKGDLVISNSTTMVIHSIDFIKNEYVYGSKFRDLKFKETTISLLKTKEEIDIYQKETFNKICNIKYRI